MASGEMSAPIRTDWLRRPPAERTTVASIARAVPTCRVDAERADVEALFGILGTREIVVLDGDGRPAGVILPQDLARDADTARGLLSPIVLALHASMPVSIAEGLMKAQGIDQIPVVDASRRFLGLLTRGDLDAWLDGALEERVWIR
jgi:CBS domain-containing protein